MTIPSFPQLGGRKNSLKELKEPLLGTKSSRADFSDDSQSQIKTAPKKDQLSFSAPKYLPSNGSSEIATLNLKLASHKGDLEGIIKALQEGANPNRFNLDLSASPFLRVAVSEDNDPSKMQKAIKDYPFIKSGNTNDNLYLDVLRKQLHLAIANNDHAAFSDIKAIEEVLHGS